MAISAHPVNMNNIVINTSKLSIIVILLAVLTGCVIQDDALIEYRSTKCSIHELLVCHGKIATKIEDASRMDFTFCICESNNFINQF